MKSKKRKAKDVSPVDPTPEPLRFSSIAEGERFRLPNDESNLQLGVFIRKHVPTTFLTGNACSAMGNPVRFGCNVVVERAEA